MACVLMQRNELQVQLYSAYVYGQDVQSLLDEGASPIEMYEEVS